MLQFNSPETARRTAIYVRISTNKQQTDRQVVELKEYASKAGITITDDDIFTDIISGFKDGELRPQYSLLKQKIEAGEYQQILFSEFSRLESSRCPLPVRDDPHRGRKQGSSYQVLAGDDT